MQFPLTIIKLIFQKTKYWGYKRMTHKIVIFQYVEIQKEIQMPLVIW
jgi:hypothetical protein